MALPSVQVRFKDRFAERRLVAGRLVVAGVVVVLALMALIARLFHLQVADHAYYSTLSEDNRVRIEPLPPTRGLIYDANGVLLADNYPTHSLEMVLDKVDDPEATIAELAQILTIDEADRRRFERLRRQLRRYEGVPIRLRLNDEEIARFAVDAHRFPGVDVRAELVRYYPLAEHTAHVLGYVGRINEVEMRRIDASAYAGTHFIGKGGLEKAYEDLLHGRVGHRQVEVNARGRVQRVLTSQLPVPGRDLHLFLDIYLQQEAAAALGERRGALVAIDPRTGGVLALVSRPSFDPNLFVEGISQADYDALLGSLDQPLFNRAVRGQYPPGSTVKPFIGLGGLAAGVVTFRQEKWCPGHYSLPGHTHRFRDWKRGGHGRVNMERAIVESCDVYFYDLAHQLGIDRLHEALAGFGFGARTGIDVAGELGGLLPSRAWKRAARGQSWYPGETLILGIGQGYFLATPLQLAAATAALAARGEYRVPRVVRTTRAPADAVPEATLAAGHSIAQARARDWEDVIEAMANVIEGPAGTARQIRHPAYRIAGKTGTSQVFSLGQTQRYRAEEIEERLRDHALFVAFAPVAEPRIAVAVIVENGGGGGAVAAPVAAQVIDAYLSRPQVLEAAGGRYDR
ncbi:penicillin-binding protein 2 [Thiococcus pfennigii]|uniref:penicillin-binding protein 2 n=1 Tax=Thiococcus pfennigii TaxID=1057 RepID=UPI0019077A3E|nr:penicillin-binding protein 2 [Thiococcus pfennigii]MBK1700909.1 penicillin-binding protein 2 [Thiococcus pfennigii]